jgi:hypothetical protein
VILLLALAAFLPIGTVPADQATPVLLPGSSQSITEAVTSSTDIAIVKFTDTGVSDAAGLNRQEYGKVKIKILDVLKGKNIGTFNLGYTVYWGESLPNHNDAYILIMCLGPDSALKIIPATEGNIVMVKKLMAQAPTK